MNISQAYLASGVNSKLRRYYESIGIIPKATRNKSGYRSYSEKDIHTLNFVKRSRDLGFSLEEIKQLLSLWKNKNRSSKEVKNLVLKHIAMLENKIKELEAMTYTLKNLAKTCHGDSRPDCPILKDISGNHCETCP